MQRKNTLVGVGAVDHRDALLADREALAAALNEWRGILREKHPKLLDQTLTAHIRAVWAPL